ncbi:MAG: hypothetical protein NTY73_04305 [Candidatus Micrarchaeota archaeon]|nr:hypothetical protein [Candidatus Micrarchaeota archaeon]
MRGQTALEYLITYGWAIVAISVIMVLLFYMNVFNPATWMPVSNEAVGLSVFGITDFSVNGSGWIVLYVVNNAQASVNLTDIKIQGSSLASPSPSLPRLLSPGTNLTISGISTIVGNKGDAFYSDAIAFNYSVIGGANHTDSGILRGKID